MSSDKKRVSSFFIVALWFLVVSFLSPGAVLTAKAGEEAMSIFAAASTTDAVTQICELFNAKQTGTATPSFAASSTLARQIENGAPADIYISANQKWMDYLGKKKMIESSSRFDLLGNRIVLIAPVEGGIEKVDVNKNMDLATLLGDWRLAMGDPDHVPAGIYAKQALENLGVWKSVADKIAPCKTVRAALVLVERGETPLGVVYSTDAAISDKVKVVGEFPGESHPPIVYPAAIVSGRRTPVVESMITFLKGPEAAAVFKKYGFWVP